MDYGLIPLQRSSCLESDKSKARVATSIRTLEFKLTKLRFYFRSRTPRSWRGSSRRKRKRRRNRRRRPSRSRRRSTKTIRRKASLNRFPEQSLSRLARRRLKWAFPYNSRFLWAEALAQQLALSSNLVVVSSNHVFTFSCLSGSAILKKFWWSLVKLEFLGSIPALAENERVCKVTYPQSM